MKKIFSIFMGASLSLIGIQQVRAQDNHSQNGFYQHSYSARNSGSFDRNSSLVSLGYGFPNQTVGGGWENGFGPLYLKYEHGIIDEIGISAYLGVAGAHWKTPVYTDKAKSLALGVVGYYHFNKFIPVSKLDVYAGIGIGFTTVHFSHDDNSPLADLHSGTDFNLNGVFKAGARWYFTPGFSVFVEGGYDAMSNVNLGVSVRLK